MKANEKLDIGNEYCADLEMRVHAQYIQSILAAKYGLVQIKDAVGEETGCLEFRLNSAKWILIRLMKKGKIWILPKNSRRYRIARAVYKELKKAVSLYRNRKRG